MRRACSLVLLMLAPILAHAQTAQDEVTASAQFDRGLSEMKAGRFDVACPALAESYHLDPRAGTLFTLAECESKWGLIATAVAHYEDYLARFSKMTPEQKRGQRGREKIASQQVGQLKPEIPTLTVQLPKDAPSNVSVTRDEVQLGRASYGVALPIDPGEHVIATITPDGKREKHFTITRRDSMTIEVELPEAKPAPAPIVPTTAPVKESPPPPPPEEHASSHVGWSITALGVGIAGVGIGAITGALTIGKKGDIERNCIDVVCNSIGKNAASDAQTLGLASTIAFGVGAAGLVVSVILFVTEPHKSKKSAFTPIGVFTW